MYKAVIFDFFGVFCPDITMNWFKKMSPNYEVKLPEFQTICTRSDYGTLSRADFYKEVSALLGVSVDEMEKGVEAETVINTPLVDYIKELRQEGCRTACLSNGTHEWTLAVINNHGLTHLFDRIVLSGDLGVVKPSPEIYNHTLEKLNVAASEAIFVDDRKVNVDAAEACGIHGLLFDNTETFINDLEQLVATAQ
ncbi:MAG TPA: HAD family phosphatase [Candidatus Saccharimonadia bacterium]|nr:HAD family phosphatase [Candidatus Saccharimonadia bacterium]